MATLAELNPAVMTAIDRLKYQATIGDVATQSGLNIAIAEQGVLALAAETGAKMQVTEAGDIIYSFPKDFRSKLQNKYWQLQLQAWWDGISGTLFWAVRFAFGCSLFVVLFVMIGVAFVMITAMNSSQDNNDSGGSFDMGGMGGGFYGGWYGWSWDWLSFNGQQRESGSKLSFMETIFSFVFGDGDPNRHLETQRWETIAQRIVQSRGAVVAEQLTPYLDVPPNQSDSNDADQHILPALVRFNGTPQVTDDGQLIYVFPELQKTAVKRRSDALPDYLEEQPWRLSLGDPTLVTYAAMIGILILVMSLFFTGTLPRSMPAPEGILRSLSYGALAYSGFYLGWPLVRWFLQWGKNDRINARNRDRAKRGRQLKTPDEQLQQKLIQAKQFQARLQLNKQTMAYDSDRDLIDQDLEQHDQIDTEWQKKLDQG